MNLYINSTGIVSSGGTNSREDFLCITPDYHTDHLQAIEPDYKPFIPPMQLRRMSKAVRMGIAASKVALETAGIEKPDAISVGTAIGCIQDSEVFLQKMIDQDEQMLTPTAFIQSTHNTVAGAIALGAGCNGHNLTFVQRGHSFEHALVNSQLYLEEHPGETVLAGGIDELIDMSLAIFKRAGIYKCETVTPNDILTKQSPGSIAGEGAAFFTVTNAPKGSHSLHIKDISLFTAKDNDVAVRKIKSIVQQYQQDGAIDFVMLGLNGDEAVAKVYDELRASIFNEMPQLAFKHLSGEYATVSSVALGLLYQVTKDKNVPDFLVLNKPPENFKRFLLVNNYIHYYSCWLIEVAG